MEKANKMKLSEAELIKENKALRNLLNKMASMLTDTLDNMEGSVGSCDSDDYAKEYFRARRFLTKHFNAKAEKRYP